MTCWPTVDIDDQSRMYYTGLHLAYWDPFSIEFWYVYCNALGDLAAGQSITLQPAQKYDIDMVSQLVRLQDVKPCILDFLRREPLA